MAPRSFEDMFACSPASLTKLRASHAPHASPAASHARDYSPIAFPSMRRDDDDERARAVAGAFDDMFACSPASLKKMRGSAVERASGGVGTPTGTPTRPTASREDLASAFGDMFLASPASLKKIRATNTAVTGTKARERGDGFGSPLRYDGDANAAEPKKEAVSFSEMFASSPSDLAKMRRSDVGGAARGSNVEVAKVAVDARERTNAFAGMFASSPADLAKMRRSDVGGAARGSNVEVAKVAVDARERTNAFAGMFASSPADLAKMRGRSQSSISYAEGRHGASDRFQVIAPDFQAMFSSSPSDLKNLRSASSSSRKRLGDEADRFEVTYLLLAPCEAAAREKVLEICLEQTVELPASLVPEGTWIREHVVGRLESLTKPKTGPHARRPDAWNAIVSYHADTAGGELTQLVNVIFGNTSMKENVMVVDIELPRTMLREYPGPRFGVHGLRRLLRVPEGPLVMTALKPMGLSSQELAEIAYGFAKGGIDIIKDDHGLADQPYSPYDERVRMCAAAVARANAETGRNVLYAPCINAPAHLIISRAHAARQAGAGAVLMIPGITGLDAMRELAADPSFNLPIIAHPALLGCMLGGGSTNRIAGFSHEVLLGLLPRLAGADATVFPSFGGRFGFSVDECKAINVGCTRVMGDLPAILPSPGGGMTLERIAQMREVYGPDLLLLIGGSLYSHSENLVDGARHFMKLAGRKELYGPLECPHDGYRGHTM
jgi:ribulose-bisphosphate carboxylase large chain